MGPLTTRRPGPDWPGSRNFAKNAIGAAASPSRRASSARACRRVINV